MENKLFSFVIPCYGSEHTIEHVIAEIVEVVKLRPGWDYEIICVNDCSPDGVLVVLKRMTEDNSKILIVDLATNRGKHAAQMAGFTYSSGEYIVTLDDDGQCPTNRLWELVDAVNNGYDAAVANFTIRQETAFKKFGSHINLMMSQWLIGQPKDFIFGSFRVYRRFVIDEILRYKNSYPYVPGLTLRATSKLVNIPMEERGRFAGKGNYTFMKSLSMWLNGFTAFSVRPLRLSMFIGFITAFIGGAYGIYTIIHRLLNSQVPIGYSSIMSALLFIGGIIMCMLGLIGEYVGRIYISVNNSPQFVVREVIRSEQNHSD